MKGIDFCAIRFVPYRLAPRMNGIPPEAKRGVFDPFAITEGLPFLNQETEETVYLTM